MKYQQLIDSLMSELNKPKHLTANEKTQLFANVVFSCTLSGFAIFLSQQQTLALCKEDLHCSAEGAWIFFIPNGISNSFVTAFTSSQIFSAAQRAWIGKNSYLNKKTNKKASLRLALSMLTGMLAAIPLMLSTEDPVGSKLVFVANFIIASYSFYTIAQDLSISSSYAQPHVQKFLQTLKSYELRSASIPHVSIPSWIKISSAILLPLFFNGSFCINNILLLNNPDNNLGALHYILPEGRDNRLIASVLLGTTFTVPWFILAGLFGYHLPDTILQQFYQNQFSKVNPNINMSMQITAGIISLCSFAVPVKFFIDVKEELFDSCEDICTFLTVIVAISGSLFSLMPNLKIGELIIIFWNLFFTSDVKNRDETFDIINARELAAEFKNIQATLPAEDVNEISEELNHRLSTMTERTALLQYPQSIPHQLTYSLSALENDSNSIKLDI
jgi:hypothetical protein